MNVLALDLATKTGWAHSCGESGVWDLSVQRDESGGMRFIRLRAKLGEMLRGVGVDVVYYELPFAHKKNKTGCDVGTKLTAIVESWALENGLEYCGKTNSDVKKHATGKGRVDKDAMIAAAEEKFEIAIIDDNHADALWLLDLAMTELNLA